eukprot:1869943-Ditylum_brightwellii.AAC.1
MAEEKDSTHGQTASLVLPDDWNNTVVDKWWQWFASMVMTSSTPRLEGKDVRTLDGVLYEHVFKMKYIALS